MNVRKTRNIHSNFLLLISIKNKKKKRIFESGALLHLSSLLISQMFFLTKYEYNYDQHQQNDEEEKMRSEDFECI